jgi:CubicO group peptidase (beta-lactamase class C family)
MLRRLALLLPLFAVACATGMTRSIDEVMKEYDGAVPGASVLVLRDGRPVFERSYGLADVENGIAATPATHYRLASVTKQFTAAAILTLEAEGKLSLDESVRRQLPSLPSWAEPVTIRHLLTHTSGLVDYEDVIPPGTTRQLTDADVLHLLEQQPALDFPAGSRYRYSNSGYALLALIVERASATSFATYLHDAIFAPRGMATAVAHVEGVSIVPSRAFGTSRDGDHWKRTDQSLTSAVLGDGGIYASVDDLASWLRALEGGDFERTMTPQVETDKPEIRYGFGWRISSHDGRRMVWHTGETIGFRNALIRFPDERLAVVVLTNRNEGDPLQRALLIADLLH